MVLRASGSPEPDADCPPIDVDDVLAGYRTARAQQALFDVRGAAPAPATTNSSTRQAMSGRPGRSSPNASASAAAAGWTGCGRSVRSLVDNDGITYIQVDRHGDAVTNGDGTAEPGPWHLDALPLVVSAPTGTCWKPVWCSARGCSTPC